MRFRDATPDDWPSIWPFWQRIALARDTYNWDPDTTSATARDGWMVRAPGRTIVGEREGVVRASAQLQPNYGPASRIANASFIVDPDAANQGIGRALVTHVLDQARVDGYRAMVFNAVVETNANALHLYDTFGFTIMTTIPEAFDHPRLGLVGVHVMYLKL